MNQDQILLLLEKYTANTISAEERSALFAALTSGLYDDLVSQHFNRKLLDGNLEGDNLPPYRSAEIIRKVLASEKQNAILLPKAQKRPLVFRWTVAAACVSLILFSLYFFTGNDKNQEQSPVAFAADMMKMENKSTRALPIKMADGSTITLQPGSIIHYPAHFLADKREVFLEGEAFFDVSKNPSRPFFVYNRNIVTHVLGTSFNVKVNKETLQVEVAVRSGRVEVYEKEVSKKDREEKRSNGVVLLPNQKVVYDEATKHFVSSLVDRPQPVVAETNDKDAFIKQPVFNETPLKTILPYLEKSYGIEIVVEKDSLYNCLFTGDISKQELYTRLDVICQAIGATYEVKGTRILIKGRGCN